MSQKICSYKVGSVGKIGTLKGCINVFLFCPQVETEKIVVTVCTGTYSQPITNCRLKLISAGF